MSQLKVFLSDSFNPHLNLATEEWIFHNLNPSSQILFLWRNKESVVVGRNQNPWSECNLSKMKEDNIYLARRTTGGGAVFHDLGNTNFTFLSPREFYRRGNNVKIILDALIEFGVYGEASGRNDLMVSSQDGPRKFSGSAYREKKDRAFHHGTLLLNTDLSKLSQYLTPHPKKLQAKGKESVRARVANLSEFSPQIQHQKVVDAIIHSFENFYSAKVEIESLSMTSLQEIPELKTQFENLSSFDWLYGQTLAFTQQIDEYLSLGFFDFQFKIADAVITDIKIYSDCLYPSLIEDMTQALISETFTIDTIRRQFLKLHLKYPELSKGINELEELLIREIEI